MAPQNPPTEAADPKKESGEKLFRLKFNRPDGTDVELELPASEAHQHVTKHLTSLQQIRKYLGR